MGSIPPPPAPDWAAVLTGLRARLSRGGAGPDEGKETGRGMKTGRGPSWSKRARPEWHPRLGGIGVRGPGGTLVGGAEGGEGGMWLVGRDGMLEGGLLCAQVGGMR